MNKEIRNMAASVKDRLLRIAKFNKVDYTRILQRYAQERFLYRLSVSDFRSNLVLKGAMMFLAYGLPDLRPTKDIDFLGTAISNEPDNIEMIIKQISSIPCNDGIIDQIQPLIMVYSKETALAEKLQIIVSLNYETSRMKDFYDIYYLCSHSSFHLSNLRKAILETFENRNTTFQDIDIVFSTEFITNKEKQTQWEAFLVRSGLDNKLSFLELMKKLKTFFVPLLKSSEDLIWKPKQWCWDKN